MLVVGVVAWRGEKDKPEVVEGSDVHGQESVGEESQDYVSCPDSAEGESLSDFRVCRCLWCGGRLHLHVHPSSRN